MRAVNRLLPSLRRLKISSPVSLTHVEVSPLRSPSQIPLPPTPRTPMSYAATPTSPVIERSSDDKLIEAEALQSASREALELLDGLKSDRNVLDVVQIRTAQLEASVKSLGQIEVSEEQADTFRTLYSVIDWIETRPEHLPSRDYRDTRGPCAVSFSQAYRLERAKLIVEREYHQTTTKAEGKDITQLLNRIEQLKRTLDATLARTRTRVERIHALDEVVGPLLHMDDETTKLGWFWSAKKVADGATGIKADAEMLWRTVRREIESQVLSALRDHRLV